VVHAGDRVGAACEIHVEVLKLRGPVLGEAILDARAGGPTDQSLILFETEELALEFTVGEATCSVQHHVIDGVADAGAQCAEPGIRKLVRSEGIVGGAGLNVRFETEHKLAYLQIVAELTTASDAARLGDVVC